MSNYLFFGSGKYYVIDTTGIVASLPANSNSVRVWVQDADIFVQLGRADLQLADCVIPTNSEDPCSAFVPNSTWVDVAHQVGDKLAMKARSGTAKVFVISMEGRN